MRTQLGECRNCHVLVHAPEEGARACPECHRALTRALVHVGFADARRVYGEPGEPYAPPAPPPPKVREFVLACADGHKARSRDEVVIDDWLHAHGILHEREPKLKGMRPDWRIPAVNVLDERTFTASRRRGEGRVVDGNVYIEYWGMANQQGYDARREEKLALYRKRRLKLIELFPEDVLRLDEKLGWLRDAPGPDRMRL